MPTAEFSSYKLGKGAVCRLIIQLFEYTNVKVGSSEGFFYLKHSNFVQNSVFNSHQLELM